jgi:hypothetical protein
MGIKRASFSTIFGIKENNLSKIRFPEFTQSSPATGPKQIKDSLSTLSQNLFGNPNSLLPSNGFFWIKSPSMPVARNLNVEFNKVDGRDWVRFFLHTNRGTATANSVGDSIDFKGYLIQRPNGTLEYSYFSTYQLANSRSSTTTTTGGNKSGFRVYLGSAGGMGFYNTSQSPCNWGSSDGAVGAGYDGSSCGSWPNSLIMGTGTGGAGYSEIGGTWSHWLWMDY